MSARRAGGKRRPRSDALENRAAIIATAARSVRPGSALDMQAVAASVGVSRSTLYRHFPTRASLEDALREDGLQAVRATIDRVLRDERPPLAALRELVDELVALGAKRRLDVLGAVPLTDGADEAIAALRNAIYSCALVGVARLS